MGRPPQNGVPAFRFTASEIAEMEACIQESNGVVPSREVLCSFAEKFSATAERAGKVTVQPKQVWNWFQNRKYAQKSKTVKSPGKLSVTPMAREDSTSVRSVPLSMPVPSGRSDNNGQLEFEAKSARDGAWYDVASFVSHRLFETGDPEVRVRFIGFGSEEDEWVNVRKHVRPRSLPCEASECVAVLPGDLILCFQEGKDQALYFDAHVLDAQRRRHDVRGCRCRFLVRYDHDLSEEIVPLRKVCRRPETDYRLQLLHAAKEFSQIDSRDSGKDPSYVSTSRDFNPAAQRTRRLEEITDETREPVTAATTGTSKVDNGSSISNNNKTENPDTHTGDDAIAAAAAAAAAATATTTTTTATVTGSCASPNTGGAN